MMHTNMAEKDTLIHILQARPRPQIVSADVIDRYATIESIWAGSEWAESRSLRLEEAADFNAWRIASQ